MGSSYDLVVIGLGIMGSAALYHASTERLKVLGIERYGRIPHAYGSSHGLTRVIRQAYFEHPDYVPLAKAAYRGWDELSRKAGKMFLAQTGGLMIGLPNSHVVSGAVMAADQHGLPYKLLEASDIRREYPQLGLENDEVAVWEPMAGYLDADGAHRALLALAQANGASILTASPVEHWDIDDTGIVVRVGGDRVRASRLIVTVGPWIRDLWPDLAVTVERQVPTWFDGPALSQFADYPIFIHEEPRSGQHCYGFPYIAGQGMKLALHHGGEIVTTNTVGRVPTDDDARAMQAALSFVPVVQNSPIVRQEVCLYTNSPDGHFIVGHWPHCEGRIVIGAGFSGHGFKFAIELGRLMVRQVFSPTALKELALFSPTRPGLYQGFMQ